MAGAGARADGALLLGHVGVGAMGKPEEKKEPGGCSSIPAGPGRGAGDRQEPLTILPLVAQPFFSAR